MKTFVVVSQSDTSNGTRNIRFCEEKKENNNLDNITFLQLETVVVKIIFLFINQNIQLDGSLSTQNTIS